MISNHEFYLSHIFKLDVIPYSNCFQSLLAKQYCSLSTLFCHNIAFYLHQSDTALFTIYISLLQYFAHLHLYETILLFVCISLTKQCPPSKLLSHNIAFYLHQSDTIVCPLSASACHQIAHNMPHYIIIFGNAN